MYYRTIEGEQFDVRFNSYLGGARFEIVIPTKGGKKTLPDWMVAKILKEHLKTVEEKYEVCEVPEYDKWYQVFPSKIDRRIFAQPRKNSDEEYLRQKLLRTLEQRYNADPFETMVPHNSANWLWRERTVDDLVQLCGNWNGGITLLWQKHLEWAQRICNGEPWGNFCKNRQLLLGEHFELIRTDYGYDTRDEKYEVIECDYTGVVNMPMHIRVAENRRLSDIMTPDGHPRVYVLQNTLPSVTRTIKNRK